MTLSKSYTFWGGVSSISMTRFLTAATNTPTPSPLCIRERGSSGDEDGMEVSISRWKTASSLLGACLASEALLLLL